MTGKITIQGPFERHDDASRLARILYAMRGYVVPVGFDFTQSRHPQEIAAYNEALALLELFSNPKKATVKIGNQTYGLMPSKS